MAFARRALRILLLSLWFPAMAIWALCTLSFGWARVRDLSRKELFWARGIARVLGLRVRVHGDLDNAASLIVSNHLSYVDILTLGAVFPLRFAPKKEILSWPLLGWFIAISQPVWVDRKSRQASLDTMNAFVDTLKNGVSLSVFPEGTSSDGKGDLLPFKSTVFEAAITGNIPVQPVLLRYRESPGVPICWYGDMTLLPHIWRLLGEKRIDAELYLLDAIAPENGEDRKGLSERVRRAMNARWADVRSEV